MLCCSTAEGVASRGRVSAGAGDLGAGSGLSADVAPVHLVDNGDVGVGEVGRGVGATDDGQVVQVIGDDGETTATESGGTIVHERAVVVRHAKVVGALDLVEVVSHVARDVVEENSDVAVTVGSALFVVETDGVAQLVSDDSWQSAAAGLEGHLVGTMVVADAGVATLSAEDGDVVVVSGGSGLVGTGRHESDASLSHPHLHSLVDGVELGLGEARGNSVRDDSLGPSVPAVGHTGAGKSGQLSVLDFVLHGVHVHVHVVVDFLVLAGGLGGSLGGSGSGDDLIDRPVIIGVFDFEFGVENLIGTQTLDVFLLSHDGSDRQKGDKEVRESHFS